MEELTSKKRVETVVSLSFIRPFIKYLFGTTLVPGIVLFKKRKKGNGQSIYCSIIGGAGGGEYFLIFPYGKKGNIVLIG